ncbi:amidohydrolase family protein [Pseudonocardia sp. H11422]|uniref:amidohydrolase family protein n=1 Tax=Pseudonocardia sp. H11422 TaxID=2835866 RepID=UPI001BDCB72D|nr:amidohydrolase family protein [Pseudonocardia sp. H11422]
MGTAIINLGRIYTGAVDSPVLECDAVAIEDGLIRRLGSRDDVLADEPELVVDAQGMVLTPGFVDCHVHPQIGDWTSRHQILDWISGYGRGGITTVISQGAVHVQGRPRTGRGAKLLAMLSAETFREYRPGGVRVLAGAIMLEPGLEREDFEEMAAAGVTHVAEIGISGIKDPEDAAPMVKAAREAGLLITMHFGGPSVAGSRGMGLDEALAIRPDVIAHINGGSTGRRDDEVHGVITELDAHVEACYHGGLRQLLMTANLLKERGEVRRLIIGSDSPSAIGISPQAVIRIVSWLIGHSDFSVGDAFAAASGNAAAAWGLEAGVVAQGRPADLLLLDAPLGSQHGDAIQALASGDFPSIAATFQAGELLPERAVNSPFPERRLQLTRRGDRN